MARAKTKCPVDLDTFTEKATEMAVYFGNERVCIINPYQFSSGSFGWRGTAKASLPVGDRWVSCQVLIQVVAINSAPGKE